MHLPMNAVKQSSGLIRSLVAAAASLSLVLPAVSASAQSSDTEAPVAVPRSAAKAPAGVQKAPAGAPQTAPASQSSEEALWRQIQALRQLPPAPAAATQPLENPEFVKSLNQHLEKSQQACNEYLKKYPKGEHAEEAQIQRLETVRILAVVNKQSLDGFQAEAQKVLKSDAPINVKAAVDYMLMGIHMDEYKDELLKSQLSPEQQQQAWGQAVTRRAKEFIAKYPKTAFAERFYMLLIDSALQEDNVPEAKSLFEEMRQAFPDSKVIPEIASAIQEVSASTQPAASQPAATQRSAPATQP